MDINQIKLKYIVVDQIQKPISDEEQLVVTAHNNRKYVFKEMKKFVYLGTAIQKNGHEKQEPRQN